jgi:hypothetical protein
MGLGFDHQVSQTPMPRAKPVFLFQREPAAGFGLAAEREAVHEGVTSDHGWSDGVKRQVNNGLHLRRVWELDDAAR